MLPAPEKLAQSAEAMAERPAALQLGLLQKVVEVAAERNSALMRPVPVELLRFLGRVTSSEPTHNQAHGAMSDRPIPLAAPSRHRSPWWARSVDRAACRPERPPLGYRPGECS
jgi:hypothetical protein